MKKKLIKKLSLNKATVSRLENEEMKLIKGAFLTIVTCNCDTDSCSIGAPCCDPEKMEKMFINEKG